MFMATVIEEDINYVDAELLEGLQAFKEIMVVHQFKRNGSYGNLINFNKMSFYDSKITKKFKHYYLGEMKFPIKRSSVTLPILSRIPGRTS